MVCFCGRRFLAPVARWAAFGDFCSASSVFRVGCSLGHCVRFPPLARPPEGACCHVTTKAFGFVFPTVQALSALVAGHIVEVDTIRIYDVWTLHSG